MERNISLDIAKAFLIFSVIVYHVVNIYYPNQIIHSFIDSYFLSLFFFISGLLANPSKMLSSSYFIVQTRRLFIPFVFCFLAYRIYLHFLSNVPILSVKSIDDSKSGYWFIFVLYSFLIVQSYIVKFTYQKSLLYKLIGQVLPFFIIVTICLLIDYEWSGYFSFLSFRRYWLLFSLGFSVSNVFYNFSFFKETWFGYICTVFYLFFLFIYVAYIKDVTSNLDFIVWILTNMSGCFTWLFIINTWGGKYLNFKWLVDVGANTLGIYIFHYYPLIAIKYIVCFGVGFDIVNILIISVLILLISYLLTVLVRRNKYASMIFLGIIK